MSLSKWEPTGLNSFRREMERAFDSFFAHEPTAFVGGDWNPALDVEETPEEVLVKAELPGLDESKISIHISGNHLVIKGEKDESEEKKEKQLHRIERSYGRFERIVPIPAAVDHDKISADYNRGVLTVHLPKDTKSAPKYIKVDVK